MKIPLRYTKLKFHFQIILKKHKKYPRSFYTAMKPTLYYGSPRPRAVRVGLWEKAAGCGRLMRALTPRTY